MSMSLASTTSVVTSRVTLAVSSCDLCPSSTLAAPLVSSTRPRPCSNSLSRPAEVGKGDGSSVASICLYYKLVGKSSMCMMCLKYRIILLIVIKNAWVILLTALRHCHSSASTVSPSSD